MSADWHLALDSQKVLGLIGEVTYGFGKKHKDLTFEEARAKFEAWVVANKKPHTVPSYQECLRRLAESFSGKRLNQIS